MKVKRLLFITSLLIGNVAVQARNSHRIITFEELPAKAQEFVNAYFGDHTVSFVRMETEITKTEYTVRFTNGMEIEFTGNGTHGQSRRMRVTKDNTVLVCFLTEHKVVEYSLDDMSIVRQFDVHQPWAAIRLQNGNTLITLESERRTIEVDKNDNIVWEIRLDEIPEQYRLHDCQSVCRLQNGNTILCSRGDDGRGPQLVEVTPDKQVVWVVNDWQNLGPATSVQILDEKGFSENPGELER